MSKNIKINYVNKSMNRDMPKIFLFLKNEIPTFDALADGVAWKVIEKMERDSSSKNDFPYSTAAAASGDDQIRQTEEPQFGAGNRCSASDNDTDVQDD